MTASLIYKGNFRCENIHSQSGSIIETDAPTDNMGKGERFSPTDLLCQALASCVVTTMALKATAMDIELMGTTANVQKIMQATPRKIAKIIVEIQYPKSLNLSEENKVLFEKIAHSCPVHKALIGNVEMEINIS